MSKPNEILKSITFKLNGRNHNVNVPTHLTLLQMLKEKVFMTGTKESCGVGECGACTVLFNGKAVNACLVLAVEADGSSIETIEGQIIEDQLSDLQKAFVKYGALQCGFCTPGMIMSAKDLLNRNPKPNRDEIVEAISGNLCRCTGYEPIIDAIQYVANQKK